MSMAGSELMLGKWFFSLNNGSLEEEPVILAAVLQHDGYKRVVLATEASLIGETYSRVFRACAESHGLKVVGEIDLPILEKAKVEAVKKLKAIDADVVVHLGLGLGLFGMTKAMHDMGWDPPRYATTALEYAHVNEHTMRDLAGWIGLESYDERNKIGQAFLDHFEAKLGRKPRYEYLTCYGRDAGAVMVQAIATARPLTGKGVVEALERVKFLPAASGGPGTKLRFGKQIRQGWMGAEYLVARRILPDGVGHVFHGSSEGTRGPVSPSAMDYPDRPTSPRPL
jgi:ABC-type branched-subunit amino acid transport system substrate-binding protein